jgi:predicted TIM-barrel fold metal-dependent hydrolase
MVEAAGQLPFISGQCHLIEPPHVFEGRMPAKWSSRAPRVTDIPNGHGQQWVYEGRATPIMRNCAVAGMTRAQWLDMTPVRYEDIRPGCYDPAARIADMDIDGITATVCMTSPGTFGFGADLFAYTSEPELSNAVVQAWNDWYLEEWVASNPARFIPVQVMSYLDPEHSAAEVRRNAERGFKAVTFRNPVDFGMPSIGSGHWDPFLAACEETGTVLLHHVDTGMNMVVAPVPTSAASAGADDDMLTAKLADTSWKYGQGSTVWQAGGMFTVNDWLWGGLTVRFPNLTVHVAESGGSWLPFLLRRLDWCLSYSLLHMQGWPDPKRSPVEMIRQSFVFSTLEPDTAVKMKDEYGIDGWMLESDYPHMESVWPHTQEHHERELAAFDPAVVRALRWENAARLYRHPIDLDTMAGDSALAGTTGDTHA